MKVGNRTTAHLLHSIFRLELRADARDDVGDVSRAETVVRHGPEPIEAELLRNPSTEVETFDKQKLPKKGLAAKIPPHRLPVSDRLCVQAEILAIFAEFREKQVVI
jgi:hypothetical protein